jgi:hypothetical protein
VKLESGSSIELPRHLSCCPGALSPACTAVSHYVQGTGILSLWKGTLCDAFSGSSSWLAAEAVAAGVLPNPSNRPSQLNILQDFSVSSEILK